MNYSRLPRSHYTAPRAALLAALVAAVAPLAHAASMPVAATQATPADALNARAAARDSFGERAIAFEANHGQTDAQVRYLSRGPGYSLFLTPSEAVLSLRGGDQNPARTGADLRRVQDDGSRRDAVIRMGFAGANPAPRLAGTAPQASRSNYFAGATALRDVAQFGKVRYQDLYPGVDLLYYGAQGQLEYDFVVAPGASAGPIALTLAGVDRMHVDAEGNLVLGTPVGDLVQHAPVAYQLVDGARRPVVAQYAVLGARKVGFRLGAYDHARPLVIDPVLVYSTYHGGTDGDYGIDIALDASSNAYVTGRANSTNFPTSAGSYDTASNGSSDIFVAKYGPTGTLVYSTYIGGAGTDEGAGIAVDGAGNAYVTGRTTSLNFPVVGAFQSALGGTQDAFVTKLNASGNALVFSTYLGGNANPSGFTSEFGYGIAVDAGGAVYVSGLTVSTNFPTTAGAFQTVGGGSLDDAFVTKFAANGASLVYSTYLGGSQYDEAYSLAIDASGNAYVGGITASSNFPVANAKQSSYGANTDGFLTKLNASGTALVYSTYVGGFNSDSIYGMAVDSAGSAYVAGVTGSSNFPVLNSLQAFNQGAATGSTDAFVAKYSAAGNTQVYSTFLGGSTNETGIGLALDGNGNAFVIGQTNSTNFPVVSALQATNASTSGLADVFVTKIGANGSGLLFSTYLGGTGDDFGNDIAVDAAGDAYLVGQTASTNFPTASPRQASNGGNVDAFVARISASNEVQLSIGDVRVTEGNSGTTNAVFTVSLNRASTAAVTFNFATANGSAASGSDYTATSLPGQSIAAGSLTKTITVPVIGDTIAEPDEVFYGNLSVVSGAVVADAQGEATIANDDVGSPPTLTINDVSVTEGNSGTSVATFTVSLSTASANTVGYDIATADGTALAGSDYTASALAGQTMAAGQTSKTFSVTVLGDTAVESNETFVVNLSNATGGAVIGHAQGVGTINDDDGIVTPTLSVSDYCISEGNSGTSLMTFRVTLSQPTSRNVTFDVATANSTAGAPTDYVAFAATGQSIPAGQTAKVFSVTVNGDTTVEPNEIFNFNVTNVANATVVDGQALGEMINDDVVLPPTLAVNDVSVNEGNNGTSLATFTVTLSRVSASAVSFDVATADNTATAGSDYVAKALAGQSIAAGQTSKTFAVTVNGDSTVEPNETFFVNLANPVGATLADSQGIGTIVNDDAAPAPVAVALGATAVSIGDIQGSSQLSAFVGQHVEVEGVVTAVTADGFFLQDEAGAADGNPETSDAIFVDSAGAFRVGDRASVAGTVREWSTGKVAQLTLTRIAADRVVVSARGVALPAPIALDATRLGAGQPVTALERYEGMRVQVAALTAVSPVGGTIDATRGVARSDGRFYAVAAGVARPFLEPGLSVFERAGRANASPAVFDANAERLLVASLGQRGATALSVDAGDTIRGMVGVLGYGAGAYQLMPDPTARVTVQSAARPKAVAARGPGEARIATLDLRQLVDDHRDGTEPVMAPAAYATRLAKTANVLCAYAGAPDIVGLAGIENKATLADLAAAANGNDGNMLFTGACYGKPAYAAKMVAGTGTRNLGFLVSGAQVRPGVSRVEVLSVAQLGAGATFRNRDGSNEALSASLPLLLVAKINDASGASQTVSVLASQVDALEGDLSAPGRNGWATQGEYLRARRAAQAGYVAGWLQARQSLAPREKIIVLGDFNASEFNDGEADLLGLVTGRPTARGKVLSYLASPVATPLTNLTTRLPAAERYTVTRDGNAQAVDHILANAAFLQANPAAKVAVARINADFGEDNLGDAGVPMRVSDHDPVVLTFGLR